MRLEELERQRDALYEESEKPDDETELEIPIVDEEKHKKRMAAILAEMEELNEKIAKLQAQVAELGDAEESKVIIQPSGSGVDLDPTFVECTVSGLVLLEESPPRRVRRADMGSDEGFRTLLDDDRQEAERNRDLPRPRRCSGTYFAAYDIARATLCPGRQTSRDRPRPDRPERLQTTQEEVILRIPASPPAPSLNSHATQQERQRSKPRFPVGHVDQRGGDPGDPAFRHSARGGRGGSADCRERQRSPRGLRGSACSNATS